MSLSPIQKQICRTEFIVNAQIVLYPNGDFVTRSNDVETVCRRVNPDDWDDDGIANERDANPTSYDGDFFGVANALPSNANMNAYYWLDLSVTGLLDCATIRVTCDGPSDLGDHLIVARTNEVCHVPLLAGATYAVESDLPIDYSTVSTEHAEIVTNSENRLTVSLPLELYFERVQMRSGGGSGRDISCGQVHGIWYSGDGKQDEDWHIDLAPVGFWDGTINTRGPVHQ